MVGVVLFFAWSALEIVVVIAMIRWGYESHQWKDWRDMEEPKYRMMEDRPLQGWPEREKRAAKHEGPKSAVKACGG